MRCRMRRTVLLASIAILIFASQVNAQNRAIQMQSPRPNEDVCLGTTLPVAATIRNLDSLPRTLVARFEIRNAVTRIRVDSAFDTLRSVVAGASIDTIFAPYETNPNILSEL